MAFKAILLVFVLYISFLSSQALVVVVGIQPNQGKWKLLRRNIGVSAMHMALLPNDRIIAFDRTNFGPSNITFPHGKCPLNNTDCFVHSVEFDPSNRNIRPLTTLTDTWCSSGALSPNGVLIQSGGNNTGDRVVRFLRPCLDCDWEEYQNGLVSPRWYASNQLLPNGKIIVVGGRRQFSYEFIPKSLKSDFIEFQLPFLKQTLSSDVMPNNLYPFLHLSPDGNLFIFANNAAILLDYVNNKVVRNYPVMPGGYSRNYPSTGSSVLLPLKLDSSSTNPKAEVMVCGGTPTNSFEKANAGVFDLATKTCGRLVINAGNASEWEMMEMPLNRAMGDMIMLPTGDVLIINGASKGAAGWRAATDPVLHPVIYGPDRNKFEVMNPTSIPRMYHSTAHLLSDGRVLVGGSNPNSNYNFTALYPTEVSLETFYPPYLCGGTKLRPNITRIHPGINLVYKQKMEINFRLKGNDGIKGDNVYVTMVAPSFTTHSFAMNQRVLVLDMVGARKKSGEDYVISGFAPGTAALAPPGYYQLFVVYNGVPSRANWIHIN